MRCRAPPPTIHAFRQGPQDAVRVGYLLVEHLAGGTDRDVAFEVLPLLEKQLTVDESGK
jgi:hypothetical protein